MITTATITYKNEYGGTYKGKSLWTTYKCKAKGVLVNGIFIHITSFYGGMATSYTLTHHRSGLKIAMFSRAKFAVQCAKALISQVDFTLTGVELKQHKHYIRETISDFYEAEDIELGYVEDGLDLDC